MRRVLRVRAETWPLKQPFTISRGTQTAAHVVVAEIAGDGYIGRGECVPYAHSGETVNGVIAAIESQAGAIANGMDRGQLQTALPPGAARNALDCAFWDLEAKISGQRVWELASLVEPAPVACAQTIGLDTPDAMGKAAAELRDWPLLKVKVDAWDVVRRIKAVQGNAPDARIVVDANEAWSMATLAVMSMELSDLGVEMIEQPLPAGDDGKLDGFISPVPLCADESCRQVIDLAALKTRYQVVNIKLDKAGGLTGALEMARAADDAGFDVMVGCTVGTSLGMAPATLLTGVATVVDLDGPLLLTRDREFGLDFTDGLIHPPDAVLWG